ncbi:MAG: hypothetical protein ACLT3Y_07935 [Ruminococcus callidus]
MKDGFLKIACVTPPLRVADCTYNADQIIAKPKRRHKPAQSLPLSRTLSDRVHLRRPVSPGDPLRGAEEELVRILNETADLSILVIVGLPYASNGALYNCAAVCCQGKMLGMVPKQNLPNYSEFYEARHFTPTGCRTPTEMRTLAAIRNMRFPLGQSCCSAVQKCRTLRSAWKFVKMSG